MLRYRLLTGTLVLAAFAAVTFWPSWWAGVLFALLAGAFLVLALREFFAMTLAMGHRGFPRLTMTMGALLVIAIAVLSSLERCPRTWLPLTETIIFAVFISLAFARISRANDWVRALYNMHVSLGAYAYLCWMLAFLVKVYFLEGGPGGGGPALFFFLVVVTKAGDIGGYVVGKSTARLLPGGNHKMVPRISPNKSWEGLAGSIAFSIGAAAALVALMGERFALGGRIVIHEWNAIAMGFGLAVIGLLGDLTESILKRASQLKDSGRALPGLGGVLDAVDSLILVAPLFYCYLCFVGD